MDNLNNCLNHFDNYNYTEIIEIFKEQLKEKDLQIRSLNEALATAHKLNENNQFLLQQSQQKIFLLEKFQSQKPWWQFWG